MKEMNDLVEIKRLMLAAGVTRLTLESPQCSLLLVTASEDISPETSVYPDATPESISTQLPPSSPASSDQTILATHIGRFQHRHSTRKLPPIIPEMAFVSGEILGFVRDDITLHPIIANCDGIISRVILQENTIVGYHTAIFYYTAADQIKSK